MLDIYEAMSGEDCGGPYVTRSLGLYFSPTDAARRVRRARREHVERVLERFLEPKVIRIWDRATQTHIESEHFSLDGPVSFKAELRSYENQERYWVAHREVR